MSLPLPSMRDASVVVAAPGGGPGSWAGAPQATLSEGVVWLSYRIRRAGHDGHGVRSVSVVVARSEDGVRFETVAMLARTVFGAESLGRPCLVAVPGGGWRLYVSCASPGTDHWWVEAVDAASPEDLADGGRTVVLPGSADTAVNDPVVLVDDRGWHAWLCCQPRQRADAPAQMTTSYATSIDGLSWQWRGPVLAHRPGCWDDGGARLSTVLARDPLTVLYDGRTRGAAYGQEVTGVAREQDGRLVPVGDGPAASSPHADGSLRYASAVLLPDGSSRFYFEAARADGAHDLCTSVPT